MSAASPAVEIFCSYAHADEVWRQKLETHLSLLKRQGLVSLWHDRLIAPGTDWAHAIDTHLETASIILLLVSADFLASDYCYGIEMQHALKRHEAGAARVIPLLVRPVDWKDAPFAHLHALPTDAKPLSIWQDEDTALADVVAGIRRVLKDLPLLAASTPRAALPPIWNIPYPHNPFFLGRESELAQVRQRLQAGQAMAVSQPQAISGLGGIGKTQLALEYAYRYHQDYTAVLWARAENTDALTSSYVALATLLRLPEREAKEQNITVQAVKTWLQTHRDWLLILDNADELMLLSDFLPPSLGGHLLLTTRASAIGRLAQRLEIETLPPEQGALFLLRRAALLAPDATLEQAAGEERELALHISGQLGGLPLALDQAGAYLEETGMDLAGYWQLYQQHRAELLRERGGLVADHPTSVATTWSLSFEQVEEKNPAAADLLRLCAYLAPDAIPEEILTMGASVLGPTLAPVAADALLLNQAIEVLRAYSLVRRDPKGKILSIHRLVQVVLRDTQKEMEQCTWAERVVLAVNATFPIRRKRLLPHALAAAQLIETYHIRCSEAGCLLDTVGGYFEGGARFQEAQQLYEHAVHFWEQLLGFEHPDVATKLNRLAHLYVMQGKDVQAKALFQRALQILEHSEHPDRADSLVGLARIYRGQGKDAQAEELYQCSLRIREEQLGPEHLDVAYSLTGLVYLYTNQGKYGHAESLCQRALRIREQALGSESEQVATSLEQLARIHESQGKYEQAEPLYQRAVHIREQHGHSVARPLSFLAHLYSTQGKDVQAESLYRQALEIRERLLGREHSETATSLNHLAALYVSQGKHEEAEPLYQRALSIQEQQVTSNPNDASAYLRRGYAYLHLKKRENACADFARYASLRPENGNTAWMEVYAALSKQHPEDEIAECLDAIAEFNPQSYEAYVCRGVALGLRDKPQEGLTALEQALQLAPRGEDAWFWKGMMCAYLGQSTVAIESIEQALQAGLPPILLTPLFWLEQRSPQFYQKYAESLLKQHGLL